MCVCGGGGGHRRAEGRDGHDGVRHQRRASLALPSAPPPLAQPGLGPTPSKPARCPQTRPSHRTPPCAGGGPGGAECRAGGAGGARGGAPGGGGAAHAPARQGAPSSPAPHPLVLLRMGFRAAHPWAWSRLARSGAGQRSHLPACLPQPGSEDLGRARLYVQTGGSAPGQRRGQIVTLGCAGRAGSAPHSAPR